MNGAHQCVLTQMLQESVWSESVGKMPKRGDVDAAGMVCDVYIYFAMLKSACGQLARDVVIRRARYDVWSVCANCRPDGCEHNLLYVIFDLAWPGCRLDLSQVRRSVSRGACPQSRP